jgi:transcriptional regulator with XRE-family HTH domain
MFPEKIFSDRLKELRIQNKLTLQQIGEAIGATKSAIGNLEHGRKKPSSDMLFELANYFNVSIDYLCGKSDVPTPPEFDLTNEIKKRHGDLAVEMLDWFVRASPSEQERSIGWLQRAVAFEVEKKSDTAKVGKNLKEAR